MQRKPASREEGKSERPVFRCDIYGARCYTALLQDFASYNKEGQSFIEAGLSLLVVFTLIQPTMQEIEFKKHIYKKYSSHFDPFSAYISSRSPRFQTTTASRKTIMMRHLCSSFPELICPSTRFGDCARSHCARTQRLFSAAFLIC